MLAITNFVKRCFNRDIFYTLTNLFGLILGVTCSIILILFVYHDLTYDTHNNHEDRIYRVAFNWSSSSQKSLSATTSSGLGPILERNVGQVESFVHFRKSTESELLFNSDNLSFYESNLYTVGNKVFEIFSHTILYGDITNALTAPQSVALSSSLANKYFEKENPVGSTIKIDGIPYNVTLVFQDLPDNSHLKYDALLSPTSPGYGNSNHLWSINDGFTYVMMQDDYPQHGFHTIYEDFFEKHMAAITRAGGYQASLLLEPLNKIHLYSESTSDLPRGNQSYVLIMCAIGIFILLVACINYVNLSVVQAIKREKEIKLRKIIGANKKEIFIGYFKESLLFSFISVTTSILLVFVVTTYLPIELLFAKKLNLTIFSPGQLISFSIGFWLLLAMFSGLYPSFYISKIGLNNMLSSDAGAINNYLTKALIGFQFIITIGVVASSILMYLQVQYLTEKPLGFSASNKLVFKLQNGENFPRIPSILEQLNQHTAIQQTAVTNNTPWQGSFVTAIELPGIDKLHSMEINRTDIDSNFVQTMAINIVEGRDFDQTRDNFSGQNMSNNVLVNRAFVEASTWDDAIGKSFMAGQRKFTVIGVVEGFHFQDLQSKISPYVFYPFNFDLSHFPKNYLQSMSAQLIVHHVDGESADAIQHIEQVLAENGIHENINIKNLDEILAVKFDVNANQTLLMALFSFICICISCLGLLGLTGYTIERRSKEIGIRKVLGATRSQIFLLINNKNIALIVICSAVGATLAHFGVSYWLESFYYKDEINFMVLPLSVSLGGILSTLTTALLVFKITNIHPSETLYK
ncbi:ABC transporter permease [Endozoicomonas sp. G2_1]|nr:ABC transporter permease [Endozoicomonas sp. G2_1]MBO9489844.1 ABC transporter permease [Endozoicomonas sp. G2_1]